MALCAATSASSQVTTAGDIYVVADPNGDITNTVAGMSPVIFPTPQEQFCRGAFNALRDAGVADDYDGIFSFSTSEEINDLSNVWIGAPVRSDASGIGRDGVFPTTSTYNSSRLGQCVYIGVLGHSKPFIGTPAEPLPADPDSAWSPSIGVPLPGLTSLTGIEMLGHEYGHHWLMGITTDENDGNGWQTFIRGYVDDNNDDSGGTMGHPNQHYSDYADSHSVMYGECITDLGNGQFQFQGCPRKYSPLDQYLMGLRDVSEVPPMMVLEDPTKPNQGLDSLPMPKTAAPTMHTGLERHDISIDDVIRAMGVRSPAYPAAPRCWRVAFVVVLAPTDTAVPPAMLTKVQKYQQRWDQWFSDATDGRGMMISSLTAPGCPVPDGGPVYPLDAGSHEPMDSGVVVVPDAGEPTPDAGSPADAGGGEVLEPSDAGPADAGTPPVMDDPIGTLKPGCGCNAGAGAVWLVLALLKRRRK